MAACYKESSQRLHWTFDENRLQELRQVDSTYLSRDEYRAMQIYLYQCTPNTFTSLTTVVRMLALKLSLRQQPIATAMVYLLRFYTKAAFVETSVYLVVAAAVYLACKIEECPQHIKTVTQEIQTVWGLGRVSSDPTKLAEAEFYLINELDTYLIVYHPYRVLTLIVEHFKVPQRDVDESWLIINDSYSTDIPLLFSPDVIAYTALYMTVIRRRYASAHESIQKFRVQFNALHLDVKELANCTAMFLSFWAFRNTSKVDAKQSLKRAIEQLDSEDASLAEKEQRSRHYKEKIMALQKN